MKIIGQHSLASKTVVGLKVLFSLCIPFLLFGAYYFFKTFRSILHSFPLGEAIHPILTGSLIYLSGIVCLAILWNLIQVFNNLKKEDYFSFVNVSRLNWSSAGMGMVSAIYLIVTVLSICTVDDLMESAVAIFILAGITVISCLGAVGVRIFSAIYQYLMQMAQAPVQS
nr:DUF2975 domain-containing protein [uncultured Solibaculum sp.]